MVDASNQLKALPSSHSTCDKTLVECGLMLAFISFLDFCGLLMKTRVILVEHDVGRQRHDLAVDFLVFGKMQTIRSNRN